MPNHIHLLLQSGATRIGRVMQRLLTGYAVTFNLRYRRAGHLFQNRYKDIICQEDPYFLELVRYITLNPAPAGIVRTPKELATFPWTSHAALIGQADRPWQVSGKVLERFGNTPTAAIAAYGTFVIEAWNQKRQDRLEGGGLIRSAGGVGAALSMLGRSEPVAWDQRILGDSVLSKKRCRPLRKKPLRGAWVGTEAWKWRCVWFLICPANPRRT